MHYPAQLSASSATERLPRQPPKSVLRILPPLTQNTSTALISKHRSDDSAGQLQTVFSARRRSSNVTFIGAPSARMISIYLRIHPIRPRDWTLANLLQTPLVVDIGSRRIRPE